MAAHVETIAVASSAALIIGILIVVIVVLSMIVIKERKLYHMQAPMHLSKYVHFKGFPTFDPWVIQGHSGWFRYRV